MTGVGWAMAGLAAGASAMTSVISASAQVETGSASLPPGLEVRAEIAHAALAEDAESIEPVDVRARYDAFERGFAEDFGVGRGSDVEELAEQMEKAFAGRLEGSMVFRWYERLEGTYDRFEGLYNRLETSTRWARSGFSVDPDMEAAIDGKVRLNVRRKVGTVDMGLDVDDAISGKLGLRLGSTVRGYRLSLDVTDIVNAGRFGFQLRRITR